MFWCFPLKSGLIELWIDMDWLRSECERALRTGWGFKYSQINETQVYHSNPAIGLYLSRSLCLAHTRKKLSDTALKHANIYLLVYNHIKNSLFGYQFSALCTSSTYFNFYLSTFKACISPSKAQFYEKYGGKSWAQAVGDSHWTKLNEEIEELVKVFEIEGVTVQRPMPYDFSQMMRTPDFESQGKMNLILRNIQVKEY